MYIFLSLFGLVFLQGPLPPEFFFIDSLSPLACSPSFLTDIPEARLSHRLNFLVRLWSLWMSQLFVASGLLASKAGG